MRRMERNTTITPTDHEKLEWARCAQAMYAREENANGHKLSAAAALPHGAVMYAEKYDQVAAIYRAWLVFDEPKGG